MFTIEKNIPFAKSGVSNKFPLHLMEVGDSFEVPTTLIPTVRAHAANYLVSNRGKKFSVRTIKSETGPTVGRCWRLA